MILPEGVILNAIREIVIATRNRKKVEEISRMLVGSGIKLMGLLDAGQCERVVEDAPDFKGNALKKARETAFSTGRTALADDSGLEVDALGGSPGVHSARFAGPDATDRDNNDRLLKALDGIPIGGRGARFVCVMALVTPDGEERTFEGSVDGIIALRQEGEGGFGYDPLFIPVGYKRSFARMSAEEKDSISHRGRALRAFAAYIRGK